MILPSGASGFGNTGNGCVAGNFFPGNVHRRNLPFFHTENWFAGLSIQDEQVTGLRTHRDRRNGTAVAMHVIQQRHRGYIVIPKIVMHGLEIPAISPVSACSATTESANRFQPFRSPP